MRILITGITGFVGSHLAEFLLNMQYDVFGTIRPRSDLKNIKGFENSLNLSYCNILDYSSIYHTIKKIEPDIIFHLAAQSFVPMSWNSPQDTLNTNIIGTLNILESVKNQNIECKIHIAGSSEEYGLVSPNEIPIDENCQLRPLSPYAVSKVATDLLAKQYHYSYKLNTITTRAFNHEGPRRGKQFVISNFIIQALESHIVRTGNINAIRDFTDVRDIIDAYWLAVNLCKPGETYNISSDKGIKIAELIPLIGKVLKKELIIINDETLNRPSDVPVLIGNSTKFRELTNWRPVFTLEETIHDMIEYWRKELKR